MSGGGWNEGVMRNVDALFGISIGHATSSSSPSPAAMRVAAYNSADGTPVYTSITVPPGSSPTNGVPEHQQYQQHPPTVAMTMKKRGRPRKYSGVVVEGTDVNMPLALMPPTGPPAAQPTIAAAAVPPQSSTGEGEFSSVSGGGGGGGEGGPLFKKVRGRPRGSTNKVKKHHHQRQHHIQQQPLSLGSAGVGFTPHVISVKAGEDVSSKIMSFSQNGPRAVCILSANGSISNVTLRQVAISGGTATYEGRFEILSLCGSFLLTEVAGHRSRTGGLSVSLAGPDGRVLGGCVAGLLTAASPVQVIVGSFIPDGRKDSKTLNHTEPTHIPSLPMPMSMPPMLFSGSGGAGGGFAAPAPGASPPSHDGGSFSESSGEEEEEEEEGSPPNHSTGGTTATNNNHHINNNTNNPHVMLSMPWR